MIRLLKIALGALFAALTAMLIGVVAAYLYIAPDLPSIENLRDTRLQVPLRVFSRDGRLIAEYGEHRRIPVSFEDMPPRVEMAFLAAEDDRFWEHPGVDYQGLLRAAIDLVLTGEKRQGGSTITMQVARNFFLSSEKTYKRKLSEILLALKIERELDKREILELYLNKIYLGNRAYGVAAAAQVYYGKDLQDLTLAQTAMIAGLPKAPSRFNPVADPARALLRRDYVLRRMRSLDYIDQAEFEAARAEPVTAELHGPDGVPGGGYLGELVRAELFERYGDEVYTAGLRAYTTMDACLQTAADRALRRALLAYDRRHGWRGPEARVELPADGADPFEAGLVAPDVTGGLARAVVVGVDERLVEVLLPGDERHLVGWEGIEWAAPYEDASHRGKAPERADEVVSPGDVVRVEIDEQGAARLAQLPAVEGAFVALDPLDGAVLAMVGGFDFFKSKFNRAVQAERQTGSGFKPFVYSAALENGFTPASLINDAPVVFDDPALEATWRPENYSGKFYGPTRLREALVKSRNLASIRLLLAIDVGPALRHVQRFGFERGALPRDLSLVLGSGTQTPLAMARGFAVFANGGFLVEPYFLARVEDAGGAVLETAAPLVACEEEDCEARIAEVRERILPEGKILAAASPAEAPPEAAVADGPGGEGDPGGQQDDGAETADAGAAVPASEAEPASQEGAATALALEDAEPSASTGGDGLEPAEEAAAGTGEAGADPLGLRPAPRVISAQNRYLMVSMMKDVVRRGTAARAYRELGRGDLAGKTGTTNDQHDAWFNGFNEQLVATSWVGFDRHEPLGAGETGGRAALPMWIDFMRAALAGRPQVESPQPDGLVTVLIDAETGERATPASAETRFEIFRDGQVPPEKDAAEVGPASAPGTEPADVTEEIF